MFSVGSFCESAVPNVIEDMKKLELIHTPGGDVK